MTSQPAYFTLGEILCLRFSIPTQVRVIAFPVRKFPSRRFWGWAYEVDHWNANGTKLRNLDDLHNFIVILMKDQPLTLRLTKALNHNNGVDGMIVTMKTKRFESRFLMDQSTRIIRNTTLRCVCYRYDRQHFNLSSHRLCYPSPPELRWQGALLSCQP